MAGTLTALPENAIIVHIGPPKTGTTAIQSALHAGRKELLERGILYPGKRGSHYLEARSLRQVPYGWDENRATPDWAIWDDMVAASLAHPGRVVISSEFFAEGDAAVVRRLIDDIGADRLHIVLAARNPASMAISTWQQVLRHGGTPILEEWLEKEFRRSSHLDEPTSWFWSRADAGILAERWRADLPPERVKVIAVNDADHQQIPRTFEEWLDLPEGFLSSRVEMDNRGLTVPENELVRQFRTLFAGKLSYGEHTRLVTSGLIKHLMQERVPAPGEQKNKLPAWAIEQAARDAGSMIERLSAMPVDIIGDLTHLRRPATAATDDQRPETVATEMAAAAVCGAVLAGAAEMRDRDARIARLQERVQRLKAHQKAGTADLDSFTARQLVGEVGRRARRRLGSRSRA